MYISVFHRRQIYLSNLKQKELINVEYFHKGEIIDHLTKITAEKK